MGAGWEELCSEGVFLSGKWLFKAITRFIT